MVSKSVICEFCNHTLRKDRLGQHVKVRHVKQLAQQFLSDDNNVLYQIIHCHKLIRVYSKTNQKAFFLFGVIGKYFEENDDVDAYLENQDNLDQHSIYLQQILSHIPLSEFFKKSMIYGTMSRENRILQQENHRLLETIKILALNRSATAGCQRLGLCPCRSLVIDA